MGQHRLCYISRNYYDLNGAGSKAKVDNEDTLAEMGAKNLGLKRTVINNKILGFLLDLSGIIRSCLLLKKGDVLFLQYPVKKYFTFLCKVSFYLRSELPIIIWKEAAVASIIEQRGAGITINTLQELEEKLKSLSLEEYDKMKENAKCLAKELNSGHFLRQALKEYFISEV